MTTTASIAAERHKIPFLNPESTDPSFTERGSNTSSDHAVR